MTSPVSAGQANPEAFAVGLLAQDLAFSYYAHTAAIRVSRDPRAQELVPEVEHGQEVAIGRVRQKDGGDHVFHFPWALGSAQAENPDTFERAFLSGALLTLGDALKRRGYFDQAPELQLVRHLRNGVAHGNRFNIDKHGRQALAQYPAHNRLAWSKSETVIFEVTPGLHGQEVLWAFMDPGDVVTLLQAVGVYLVRMGNGDALRP